MHVFFNWSFVPSGVLEGGAGRGVLATRVKAALGLKRCWGGAAAVWLLRRSSGEEENMSKINNNMLLTAGLTLVTLISRWRSGGCSEQTSSVWPQKIMQTLNHWLQKLLYSRYKLQVFNIFTTSCTTGTTLTPLSRDFALNFTVFSLALSFFSTLKTNETGQRCSVTSYVQIRILNLVSLTVSCWGWPPPPPPPPAQSAVGPATTRRRRRSPREGCPQT